jgi:hypothetical protein
MQIGREACSGALTDLNTAALHIDAREVNLDLQVQSGN